MLFFIDDNYFYYRKMTFLTEKCLFERNIVVNFYSAFNFLRAFILFLDFDLQGFELSVNQNLRFLITHDFSMFY